MSALSSKHLLGIKDISKEDIQLIFKTAENFKEVDVIDTFDVDIK